MDCMEAIRDWAALVEKHPDKLCIRHVDLVLAEGKKRPSHEKLEVMRNCLAGNVQYDNLRVLKRRNWIHEQEGERLYCMGILARKSDLTASGLDD